MPEQNPEGLHIQEVEAALKRLKPGKSHWHMRGINIRGADRVQSF